MKSVAQHVRWLGLATLASGHLASAGCAAERGRSPEANGGGRGSATAATTRNLDDSACRPEALGLGAAKRLDMSWKPPVGCTLPTLDQPTVMLSVEFAERTECDEGIMMNWGKDIPAVVFPVQASPASAGYDIYDDGKLITLVERSIAPCPSDPLPMPVNVVLVAKLPKAPANDAAVPPRAFAQKSCTIKKSCSGR